MFLNLGLPVDNLEFTPHDSPAIYQTALRFCMGLAFEFPDYYVAFNSEGKYFMNDHWTAHPEDIGQGVLTRLTAKQVIDGLGNEWGGVWMNTSSVKTGERFYRRFPDILKRNFNYDLPEKIAVAPEFWGSYAAPDKLSATSETTIPGLYYAGAPYYGFNLPGGLAVGWMSGKGAAERAAQVDRPSISWSQVNDIFKKAYAVLDAEPKNPVDARQVMRNVQNGYGKGLLLVRNEQGITDAINEIERVQSEDIPNMRVRSKSRSYNTDWRNALEVPGMANVGIAAGKAALERRECRMTHVREDYPKVDDENFLRRIAVTLKDGQYSTELVDCDYSIIPKETVSGMVNKLSIDYDQSQDPDLPFTPLPEHQVTY
jgi:succinate dehydrogenase/fumarate reductase flavoprotein subunit